MRFFDEEPDKGSKQTETIVIIPNKEATLIIMALEEYCLQHPKAKLMKKLRDSMYDKWNCFE